VKSCIDGQAKVAKEKIEAIDDTNKSITFKVIEGDLLQEYKSFKMVSSSYSQG
jgi:hypothetical protein